MSINYYLQININKYKSLERVKKILKSTEFI